MQIYSNDFIYIEIHASQVPWLKLFTHTAYKELSFCDAKTKDNLFTNLDIIEKEMLTYYKPTKINIASFGNYFPHIHFHIMARFENDEFFPEPMWGKNQRQKQDLKLPCFDEFIKTLLPKLQ